MGLLSVADMRKLTVAFCSGGRNTTALEPRALTFEEFAHLLAQPVVGEKDGPYYIRGGDLSAPLRANDHLKSADLVILDGDSGFDPETGEITDAPPMASVTEVLDRMGLQYVAHTSFSHIPGKRWKYRVIIPAKLKHEADLKACVGYVMSQLHAAGVYLSDVKENSVWAQPWYLPRVPDVAGEFGFKCISSLKGAPLDVSACVAWYVTHEAAEVEEQRIIDRPPDRPPTTDNAGQSVIRAFNAEHGVDWMRQQLEANGYKFSHLDKRKNIYRFIRPGSETGVAGVMLYQGKFGDWCTYSHHGGGDPLSHRVCDPFEVYAIFHFAGDRRAAAHSLMPSRVAGDDVKPMTAPAFATAAAGELKKPVIKAVSFLSLLTDETPDEPDYIEPNFLGPGNFALIAGPPKAQKSFLLTEILVACATGGAFLGGAFKVPRPLKVFYLQAEMNRKLLRKRARMMGFIEPDKRAALESNLYVTERFHMLLDEVGVATAADSIRAAFPDGGPDIIAIDPLANLFDGESEDRAPEVMAFLSQRVDRLRRMVNPAAAILMVHHSAKKAAEDLNRDPFVAIRGSGALRGYYDTGLIIYRKSEEGTERKVFIECRSGESPDPMTVRLTENGTFEVVDGLTSGISRSVAVRMLDEVARHWTNGKPLSLVPQTRREGRFAPLVFSRQFDVSSEQVSALIEQWLINGVCDVETVSQHTKQRGLRKLQNLT